MNVKKWHFWKKVRDWCNRKMSEAWMERGNCDSCCPRCKQWESHGNRITTTVPEDGPNDIRECLSCGFKWWAHFCPLGFAYIGPVEEDHG